MDEEQANPNDPKSPDDIQIVPSCFSNRYGVIAMPAITRMYFGEQILAGGQTLTHTGITMTTIDAENFAHLILQMVDQSRQMTAAANGQALDKSSLN